MSDMTDALNTASKTVEVGGKTFTVIELEYAADATAFTDQADGMLHIIIACVRDANGSPVFHISDIPAMRKMSKRKIQALVAAAMEVNGMVPDESAKKSDAQQ